MHIVSMVSVMNIHESTTCTTRTNRHTTIWVQFSQSGEKIYVSLMTFMNRQHSLSVMNIHESTNRTTREYITRLVSSHGVGKPQEISLSPL